MQSGFQSIMMNFNKVGATASGTKDFFELHPGLWSFGSAVIALLGVLVSGIGLYFIWAQLKASREALSASSTSAQAAADAAKIAYAATRPWLKFEVTKAYLYLSPNNLEEVGCQINYRIENIGNTPALHAGVVFRPVPTGYGTDSDIQRELESLRATKPGNPRVLFPGDGITEGRSINFPFPRQSDERMIGFKVVAAAVYKASAEGETYWTPAVLGLQHETPPPDKVYRFYRGMGNVPCLAFLSGDETPPPT